MHYDEACFMHLTPGLVHNFPKAVVVYDFCLLCTKYTYSKREGGNPGNFGLIWCHYPSCPYTFRSLYRDDASNASPYTSHLKRSHGTQLLLRDLVNPICLRDFPHVSGAVTLTQVSRNTPATPDYSTRTPLPTLTQC